MARTINIGGHEVVVGKRIAVNVLHGCGHNAVHKIPQPVPTWKTSQSQHCNSCMPDSCIDCSMALKS